MKASFLPASLALLTTAACTGGERNQSGDCPADEACSPLTPYGMHFTGVPLVGVPLIAAPKVTAVGGTQTIDLWVAEQNGDQDLIDLPFAASTDNGDALAIASIGTQSVVLRGLASGNDLLRITEPDNDLLYDRFEMAARPIDRIELRPASTETYLASQPIGFYAGEVTVGIALLSATGERLADDSLALTWAGPTPAAEEWDVYRFDDLGPGTIEATLTAAGQTGPIDITVVNAIDDVLPQGDTFPEVIRVGDQGSVCFRATSAAGAIGSVIGLPWSFAATGPVTAVISTAPNCMAIQASAAGTATVTATTLDTSATVTLTIQPAGTKPAGPALTDPRAAAGAARVDAMRGERARLVAP